jgi:uncharacterized protein YjbI with pentapeptide repeats
MLAMLFAALLAPLHFCVGCNFAGLQLSGADFAGGVYVATNFAGANLTGASFRGAQLVAANFQGANLQGVAFDAAQCTACNFEGTQLDGATFSGARMTASNFSGFKAAVGDSELRELFSRCVACGFHAASLAGRDFSGAVLAGVDFSQADLRNTRFDNATLCWYAIDGTQRVTKCASLAGARLEGASFRNVRVCADPADPASCAPVSADSLRRYSGSPLTGAILP